MNDMTNKSRLGGRKGINWLAVRTYFIEGHTITDCAERFQVSRQLVSKRASKEGWHSEADAKLTDAREKLDAASTDRKVNALRDHEEIVDWAKGVIRAGEEDISACKPGRSRIEARKLLVEAVDKVVRMDREIRGLRSGEASAQVDDDQQITIVQRRIETRVLPVDEHGRAINDVESA